MDLRVDEVTRVAGHIGLQVIVGKEQVKARIVHSEFRGFEPLLRNRLLEEAPLYASRVCGICQVSHMLASIEAIEDGLGIEVPLEARKLRDVANLAGRVQSHLLHLFLLVAPSSLKTEEHLSTIGHNGKMAIAQLVIEGRGIAQRIVQEICGRSIHPVTVVPGGFSKSINMEQISNVSKLAGKLSNIIDAIGDKVEPILVDELKERGVCLRTNYMYTLEGNIIVKDSEGTEIESFRKEEYEKHIGEREVEEGYGTYPYLKAIELPFRVGPLARLNANEAENGSGALWANRRHESVTYTHARIVESKLAVCKIMEFVAELKKEIGASPAELRFTEGEGFGAIEAPRGTLLHHYAFNKDGIITKANIVTPTAFNSPAIERDIEENITHMLGKDVDKIKERAVKVLRDYDPCIPCATHLVNVVID